MISLQVILNDVYLVSGIISQGTVDGWVTEFTVEYSEDDVIWRFITDSEGWPQVTTSVAQFEEQLDIKFWAKRKTQI